METNKEMLIEHCMDILHGKDQLCVLVSVSNTGYPLTSVVRPAGGIGMETIYFILRNNSAIVTSFENNPSIAGIISSALLDLQFYRYCSCNGSAPQFGCL